MLTSWALIKWPSDHVWNERFASDLKAEKTNISLAAADCRLIHGLSPRGTLVTGFRSLMIDSRLSMDCWCNTAMPCYTACIGALCRWSIDIHSYTCLCCIRIWWIVIVLCHATLFQALLNSCQLSLYINICFCNLR